MTDRLHTFDDIAPAWEACYEPGNVSDYLIGYANSEAAAKGAAIAWLKSQSDKDPATLEWIDVPSGDRYAQWFNLIQNAEDGMALDIGINVRHRLAAARQTTGQDDTKPTLRDRLRRAICEASGFTWDTDMLEPDEYGDHADAVLQVLGEPLPEGKEFTDPTTADDPIPLRWGLGDVLHGDDDSTTVCLSGPDREPYWLELDPERAAALRDDLTPPTQAQTALDRIRAVADEWAQTAQRYPDSRLSTEAVVFVLRTALAAPAVGQPAEAHGTEARPPRHAWRIEHYDPTAKEWAPQARYTAYEEVAERLAMLTARYPLWADKRPVERRVVRETTTWTVEDER